MHEEKWWHDPLRLKFLFFMFIFTWLFGFFFARNIFILCPAQTKLRILCRIVKLKGVSTDNDDTSRKQFFCKLYNIATKLLQFCWVWRCLLFYKLIESGVSSWNPKYSIQRKKAPALSSNIYIYIYREELNIASLYIYILNVDKINNGLKIMYSAPLDNTKALAVWGAKC